MSGKFVRHRLCFYPFFIQFFWKISENSGKSHTFSPRKKTSLKTSLQKNIANNIANNIAKTSLKTSLTTSLSRALTKTSLTTSLKTSLTTSRKTSLAQKLWFAELKLQQVLLLKKNAKTSLVQTFVRLPFLRLFWEHNGQTVFLNCKTSTSFLPLFGSQEVTDLFAMCVT